MAVSWNHTAAFKDGPGVILNRFGGDVVTNLLLHVKQEFENLLVGKSVKGSGKTSETRRIGQERVGEGRANEMGGMSRYITTLVVSYDNEDKSVWSYQAGDPAK